jgi:hypothetical protein
LHSVVACAFSTLLIFHINQVRKLTNDIIVRVATPDDKKYSETITTEMEESAKARGTGIAKRSPLYIERKMDEGKAVIAVLPNGTWVGFCYIEAWEHEKYVANSGLIVSPAFRKTGIATGIKRKIFELSRIKYPDAKIFGLTTGLAVMKINSDLGYEPVTYSELTSDDEFWKGCQSCVNYEILMSKGRKNCMCTAMLYDPVEKAKDEEEKRAQALAQSKPVPVTAEAKEFAANRKIYERFMRLKQFILLKGWKKKNGESNEKSSLMSFLFFW